MRNKFVKGLSVAFAAAMAFTVVGPALTTEAASTKAYVVSEASLADGTHKYTYDSRGRVTKEVITTGTNKLTYDVSYLRDANGVETWDKKEVTTTTTTVKDSSGAEIDTIKQATSLYKTAQATASEVISTSTETVKTFTYYNSGKLKDQVKSQTETITEKNALVMDSTNNDLDGGYTKSRVTNVNHAYTYNNKGQKVTEVVVNDAGNWTYSNVYGRDYEVSTNGDGTVVKDAAGNVLTVSGNVYGTSYDGIRSLAWAYNPNFAPAFMNPAKELNKKFVTTTTYTSSDFNDLGQAQSVDVSGKVYTYNPVQYNQLSNGEWFLGSYLEVTVESKGSNIATTYTKAGQPKKQVKTDYNETVKSNKYVNLADNGDVVAENGNVNTLLTAMGAAAPVPAANFVDGTTYTNGQDVKSTATYTYGKDQNLSKKVVSGYATAAKLINGETANGIGVKVETTTRVRSFNYDTGVYENGNVDGVYTSYVVTAETDNLNKYEKTTEYDIHTQDNTGLISAKTSEVRKTGVSVNGKDNNSVAGAGNSVVSFKLKKISVPSSRATGVFMDRYQKQLDVEWN